MFTIMTTQNNILLLAIIIKAKSVFDNILFDFYLNYYILTGSFKFRLVKLRRNKFVRNIIKDFSI